jgi:hypothetical protein
MIMCCGCYLLDFLLNKFITTNLTEYTINNREFSKYESILIQFLQHIKLSLTTEYPLNIATNSSYTSINQRQSIVSLNFSNRVLTRDSQLSFYLIFIGHLTASEKGECLLELFKIYDLLMKIVDLYKDLALMKLICTCFNFYNSPKSRLLLERSLCLSISHLDSQFKSQEYLESMNDLKIYILKLIFNYYRSNSLKFDAFFLDIIFKSLFKLTENKNSLEKLLLDRELSLDQNKVENLIELSLNLIEYFLNQRPEFINRVLESFYDDEMFILGLEKLLQKSIIIQKSNILRTKLRLLLFKFKLSDYNIDKVDKRDEVAFIDEQLKLWYCGGGVSSMHYNYFQLIERYLFDANALNSNFENEFEERNMNLDLDERDEEDGEHADFNCVKLYRKKYDKKKNLTNFLANLSQANLPFHINFAISKRLTKISPDFKSSYLDKILYKQLKIIKMNNIASEKELKACVWSVSQFCSNEYGLKYISDINQELKVYSNIFELVCTLVNMTEAHSSLSIRATCFYCLNLIAKSGTGANLVGKLGWHTFKTNRLKANETFLLFSSLINLDDVNNEFYDNNNELDLSLDFYVTFYNYCRSLAVGMGLKAINTYSPDAKLANFELDFLQEKLNSNLLAKSDQELFRFSKIGHYLESICVPMRPSLLSVNNDDHASYQFNEDTTQNYEHDFLLMHLNSVQKLDEKHCDFIIKCIDKLIPLFGNEKNKQLPLIKLKVNEPDAFNYSIYLKVNERYFFTFKIKHSVRKFLQSLFFDIISLNEARLIQQND